MDGGDAGGMANSAIAPIAKPIPQRQQTNLNISIANRDGSAAIPFRIAHRLWRGLALPELLVPRKPGCAGLARCQARIAVEHWIGAPLLGSERVAKPIGSVFIGRGRNGRGRQRDDSQEKGLHGEFSSCMNLVKGHLTRDVAIYLLGEDLLHCANHLIFRARAAE
jgi:hypothetical protein